MKPKLIRLEEVEQLSLKDVKRLYKAHVNTGLPTFLGVLGFDRILPVSSEGICIHTKDGRTIMDFSGGISVLNPGHNHPKVLAARRSFNEENRIEVWRPFLSPLYANLAKELAALAPADLNYVCFANSGAESNEGALKLAEKFQGDSKKAIIYTNISFHGKTHATLSLTGNEGDKRRYFKSLSDCVSIPYGDVEAFEEAIRTRGGGNHDIVAIILEALVAEEMVIPQAEYLQQIRTLCDSYGIVMILDEVYNGMGRSGKLFAFEHAEVIPDIFTIAKSLGGGKGSIGAYIARDHIYKQAYGTSYTEAMLHHSSFGGLGEECYSGLACLEVYEEEKLVQNAADMGEYFQSALKALQQKYPKMIKQVDSKGLLIGVEMALPAERLIQLMSKVSGFFEEFASRFTVGITVAQMMGRYDILILPGAENKSNIFINPSLIITQADIDHFIQCFGDLLSRGMFGLVWGYIRLKIKGIFS